MFTFSAVHPDDFGFVFPARQKHLSAIAYFFPEFKDDQSMKIIYAGPCAGSRGRHFCSAALPIDEIKKYIVQITEPDTKLTFDNLLEGNLTAVLYRIYTAIEGTHIKPSQIYLFTGAVGAKEFYEKFCQEYNIKEKINLYACSSWEHDCRARTQVKDIEYIIGPKPKTFLCLNRIIRFHRLTLVPLLIKNGLLEKAHLSFFPDNAYGTKHNVDMLFASLKNFISGELHDEVYRAFYENEWRFPIKLNIEPEHPLNYIRAEDAFMFKETYFSLVTETYFFDIPQYRVIDEREIFFSEKSFKPIAMKHPFIIAGKAHMLKYLKKLGYQTFSPWIDESYDDIENHEQRLLAVLKETKRLCAMSENEWIEWQKEIKLIVENNHRLLFSKPISAYRFES